MKIALLVWYLILAVSLGIKMCRHGHEKNGKHNFVTDLIGTAITLTMILWLNGWSFM